MYTLFDLVPTPELLVLYKDFYKTSLSDAALSVLIDAAKESADDFLGRDWVDDKGAVLTIPTNVKLGILKIADWFTKNKNGNVKSVRSLSVGEAYFKEADYMTGAYEYLAPHRDIGIGGA